MPKVPVKGSWENPGSAFGSALCYAGCGEAVAFLAETNRNRRSYNWTRTEPLPVCGDCQTHWRLKRWEDHEDWEQQNISFLPQGV